jgi:ADP-heptose:LPS heptosyltransferase
MKVFFVKFIDATAGAALCWLVGRVRHLLRREPPLPPDPAAVPLRRVLVIRPGGLGDMVQLLPALRALRERFPAAEVDVVCERRNAAVLQLSGLADRIACYDAHPGSVLLGLWRARYDVVLDTEQFHHMSALMALCGGAPVRIGFKINPGRNPLYTHLITYDLDGWEAAQFMRLLAPLGITGIEPVIEGILSHASRNSAINAQQPTSNAQRPTEDVQDATINAQQPTPNAQRPTSEGQDGRLAHLDVGRWALDVGRSSSPSTLPAPILLHPGATTRHKAWPTDRWVALIERLQAATGRPMVLVGGRSEAALAGRILAQCGSQEMQNNQQPTSNAQRPSGAATLFPRWALGVGRWMLGVRPVAPPSFLSTLAGRTTVEEMAAALGRAALFVGGDSGLAHLAVAMGTPTVVLFGPSDSRKWGARGPGHAVVRRELACSPCAIFGYHKLCRSMACMEGITVGEVAAACVEQLGG